MTREELSDRLWRFAARIPKVVDALPDSRVGRHIAGQIVRSEIAAAPNYDESRSGERLWAHFAFWVVFRLGNDFRQTND